jgi:hypothetical protein
MLLLLEDVDLLLLGSDDELVEVEVELLDRIEALVDDVDSEFKDEEVLIVEESMDVDVVGVVVKDTTLLLRDVDAKLVMEPEEVVVALMEEGNDEPLTEEEDELVGPMLEVEESPA